MNDKQFNLNQLRQYQSMPLGAKIRLTEMRIRQWYEAFDGMVYAAFSGGKDSTVMLDIIWSLYPDVPAVFSNTGNELDSILEFVKGYGDRVIWVKPKMSFEDVVKKYGYPIISKKVSDYISRCRKTKSESVLKRHLKGLNADGSPSPMSKIPNKWQKFIGGDINVTNKCCGILKDNPTSEYRKKTGRKAFVGTMAEESMARMNSYLNHGGCNAFDQKDQCSRPIMFWTEQDVLNYVKTYDLEIAQAYWGETKLGHTRFIENDDGTLKCAGDQRTGCKFCLFGVHLEKGENRIQRLARIEPESYRHAIEDLNYDKVMDQLGVDWRPYERKEQMVFFE